MLQNQYLPRIVVVVIVVVVVDTVTVSIGIVVVVIVGTVTVSIGIVVVDEDGNKIEVWLVNADVDILCGLLVMVVKIE